MKCVNTLQLDRLGGLLIACRRQVMLEPRPGQTKKTLLAFASSSLSTRNMKKDRSALCQNCMSV